MKSSIKIVSINDSWMNVSSSKRLYFELIECWVDFFMFFSPAAIIVNKLSKNSFYFGLLLMIPFVLQSLFKRYSKNLILYLILNIAIIAITLAAFPSLCEKIAYSILLGIRFIILLKERYSESIEFRNFKFVIFITGEFFLVTIIAEYIKAQNMNLYFMIAALNNILFTLIYINVTRTDNLMKWEGTYLDKFKRKIKMAKLMIATIMVAIMAAANIIFWKSGLYTFMDFLQNKILSLLNYKESTVKQKVNIVDKASQNSNNTNVDFSKLSKNYKSNPFIDVVVRIVEIIIYFAIVLVVIYFIWLLALKLKELYNEFGRKKSSSEEKKELLISTKDVTYAINNGLFKLRKSTMDIFDNSNNKRIRKAYYKLIRKNMKAGVAIASNNTPFEIKESIEHKTSRDYKNVTEIYEKARYGDGQCQEKDVENMKKFSR